MKFYNKENLMPKDYEILKDKVNFIPGEIIDIHCHLYNANHFGENAWTFLKDNGIKELNCKDHRLSVQRYIPSKIIHGLYFGLPHASAKNDEMNNWLKKDVDQNGTVLSRVLRVTAPNADQSLTAEELRSGRYSGIKVYHVYANRKDTMNAYIPEYAPEWMWEILDEVEGILMLHLVRDGAISDERNQKDLLRLCASYPRVKVVLAHNARCFNYRNARKGLRILEPLDNVVVDTSAICEVESFRATWDILGPRRILWGSDFPISEGRGRCVTTGDNFFWLHPEDLRSDLKPATEMSMTLVGIEELLSLKELFEDVGATENDIQDIFLNNGLRVMKQQLPSEAIPKEIDGPKLWLRANEVISCGTGLMSKRAEQFDLNTWPAYYSRCSGSEVWDVKGKRYIDFVGAVGAIFLGYSDPDINSAVKRRISLGSYSSLVNPEEIELAERLLSLNPWARKVRYSRTGGEAMAIAVRIARAATGKSGIALCGYHGWSDWYLASNLNNNHALDGHLLPGLEPKGVPAELTGTSVPFRYNDITSLKTAVSKLNDNFAAVVMEPMRSQYPKDDFLSQVMKICRENNAILIIDEITSGLRYGFPGALSKLNLEPDIVVYAKAMSNGFPFGVILGRKEIMEAAESSFISSSYWTDGVGTAAALAVIKKVQRLSAHEIVWRRGEQFLNKLKNISSRYPDCKMMVNGLPATPAIKFNLDDKEIAAKTFFIREMLKRGFLASTYFYLMYSHSEKQLNFLSEAMDEVLYEMNFLIRSERLLKEVNFEGNRFGFARLA